VTIVTSAPRARRVEADLVDGPDVLLRGGEVGQHGVRTGASPTRRSGCSWNESFDFDGSAFEPLVEDEYAIVQICKNPPVA
jgi:hypothetical protein